MKVRYNGNVHIRSFSYEDLSKLGKTRILESFSLDSRVSREAEVSEDVARALVASGEFSYVGIPPEPTTTVSDGTRRPRRGSQV